MGSLQSINLLSLCPTDHLALVVKSLQLRKNCLSHITFVLPEGVKELVSKVFREDTPKLSIERSIKFIFYEDCFRCQYQKYKESSFLPLDIGIYAQMQPYQDEIMACMWRSVKSYDLNDDYLSLSNQYTEHLKFWYWYIRKYQINLYIGGVPHSIFDSFIYYICKVLAIPTVLFYPSPLQGKLLMMSDWRESSISTRDYYLNLKKSVLESKIEVENFLDLNDNAILEFIGRQEKKEPPAYMRIRQFHNLLKLGFSQLMVNIPKQLFSGNISKALTLAAVSIPYKSALTIFLNLKYSLFLRKVEIRVINTRERYIYFPLHYQPECSTLPLGGVFANQLLAIEWLLWTKPNDVVIYVREHPKQFFSRYTVRYKSIEFYQKILSMPDVKLISRDINSFDLIDSSTAVATVTGTVSLEAIWREKPVFLFGYHVYQYAPGIFPIRNLEDCYSAMKQIFEESFRPKKKDVILFLKALSETSLPLESSFGEQMATPYDLDNVDYFADRLYYFIVSQFG